MSAFTKIAACGLKEIPQMPPYITPMLSMLCLNFNIHCQYSNFRSLLKSFDISSTHQYNLIALMSNKAYPFLFSHNFKVILDTRKTRKKKKKDFSWTVSGGQGNFHLHFSCYGHSYISTIFKQKHLILIYRAETKHFSWVNLNAFPISMEKFQFRSHLH